MSSKSLTLLPQIDSEWQSGAEFLETFEMVDDTGTFFHPTGEQTPPGASPGHVVSVAIRFLDRGTEFHVHAKVLVQEMRGGQNGLRLAFLPEESDRQELVLTSARGESLPYFRRRHERTPCDLQVVVTPAEGAPIKTSTISVSEGGTRLHLGSCDLAVGAVVRLVIAFSDGDGPFAVRGRVASIVRSGPQPSLGVEFLFASADHRETLQRQVELVRRASPAPDPDPDDPEA